MPALPLDGPPARPAARRPAAEGAAQYRRTPAPVPRPRYLRTPARSAAPRCYGTAHERLAPELKRPDYQGMAQSRTRRRSGRGAVPGPDAPAAALLAHANHPAA